MLPAVELLCPTRLQPSVLASPPHCSDFNLPKILAQDLDVFCGLLADIFPGVSPLRQVRGWRIVLRMLLLSGRGFTST